MLNKKKKDCLLCARFACVCRFILLCHSLQLLSCASCHLFLFTGANYNSEQFLLLIHFSLSSCFLCVLSTWRWGNGNSMSCCWGRHLYCTVQVIDDLFFLFKGEIWSYYFFLWILLFSVPKLYMYTYSLWIPEATGKVAVMWTLCPQDDVWRTVGVEATWGEMHEV